MRRDDLEDARGLPLFRDSDPERVEALLQNSFVQRFPALVELLREGDQPEYLHAVVEGRVSLGATHGSRETVADVLTPGKNFVVSSVMLDRPYLVSARALSPVRILMVPAEIVRRVFNEDAAFARRIAVELAIVSRGLIKEIKNQKLRTSLERLANWLLVHNKAAGGRGSFELPIDKKVLAARLGMAPEVLSRSFATLAQNGVSVNGPMITIRDPEALATLAEPSPTIDDPEEPVFISGVPELVGGR